MENGEDDDDDNDVWQVTSWEGGVWVVSDGNGFSTPSRLIQVSSNCWRLIQPDT